MASPSFRFGNTMNSIVIDENMDRDSDRIKNIPVSGIGPHQVSK